VLQSHSDGVDSDPLLEFLSELQAAESAPQPGEKTEDPPVVGALDASATINPLNERIENLEQALNEATGEVAALRSQVATLVRATRDIDKRVDRIGAPVPITNPRRSRTVTAIVAMVFGVALATWLWSYATSNRNPIVVSAAAESPAAPVVPPPPVESNPPVTESPKPAAATSTPQPKSTPQPTSTPQSTSTPQRVEPQPVPRRTAYVGTLSIDASPGGLVMVNGKDAGRTPLRLENLKAGAHLIWIERDGYRRWTKVVDVSAGKISRVFADLEPIAAR
jgi:hypothetical protein